MARRLKSEINNFSMSLPLEVLLCIEEFACEPPPLPDRDAVVQRTQKQLQYGENLRDHQEKIRPLTVVCRAFYSVATKALWRIISPEDCDHFDAIIDRTLYRPTRMIHDYSPSPTAHLNNNNPTSCSSNNSYSSNLSKSKSNSSTVVTQLGNLCQCLDLTTTDPSKLNDFYDNVGDLIPTSFPKVHSLYFPQMGAFDIIVCVPTWSSLQNLYGLGGPCLEGSNLSIMLSSCRGLRTLAIDNGEIPTNAIGELCRGARLTSLLMDHRSCHLTILALGWDTSILWHDLIEASSSLVGLKAMLLEGQIYSTVPHMLEDFVSKLPPKLEIFNFKGNSNFPLMGRLEGALIRAPTLKNLTTRFELVGPAFFEQIRILASNSTSNEDEDNESIPNNNNQNDLVVASSSSSPSLTSISPTSPSSTPSLSLECLSVSCLLDWVESDHSHSRRHRFFWKNQKEIIAAARYICRLREEGYELDEMLLLRVHKLTAEED